MTIPVTHTRAAGTALRLAPLSVRALGVAAGVQSSQLWRVLTGQRRLTPAMATRLAEALDDHVRQCRAAAAALRRLAGDT